MTYSIEVPELCRFLGIVIGMFYREHGPAHFHAVYGEFDITVELNPASSTGSSPKEPSPMCSNGMDCIEKNSWTTGD